jgi:dihydroorotase
MKLLIKNVTILDKNSEWNNRKTDILIENDQIKEIEENIETQNCEILDLQDAFVSPGWFDIGTRLTDPGFESFDDMVSMSNSALRGGFTGLAVFPNTEPVNDNKSIVLGIINKSGNLPVDFFPISAISKSCKGTELSEMMDLHANGAIAFSDGKTPLHHSGLMSRALQYVTSIGVPIINHPEDAQLSENGVVNEGKMSVYLGMKGRPALAESIMLYRDISLCEYNNSHLISHMISTADSVKQLNDAKKRKINVHATVSYHSLVANEDSQKEFDSMHKVLPPLRTAQDNNALVKGLKDGTLDAIVSNHYPLDVEDKKKAFFDAKYGALGLETLFEILNYNVGEKIGLEVIIDAISNKPREILGLPPATIKTNSFANLTFFSDNGISEIKSSDIKSKSSNTPFIGSKTKGKVIGTYYKGKLNKNF